MQYGVCCGLDEVAVAADAGYDYFEWSVGEALMPREDGDAFAAALARGREAALRFPVLCIFVPGALKITGPDAAIAALERYARTVFARAEEAGVRTIVFGSGGAREIPEGFDRVRAHGQLVDFCRMLAPVAEAHGVTVVVEPLHRGQCNVLTTVRDCRECVKAVDRDSVRLLVDAHHLMVEGDSLDDVVRYGKLLRHVHIATAERRLPPGAEPCDLGPFFEALVRAGYDGRISVEGRIGEAAATLPPALSHMRELEAPAKEARGRD